MAKGGASTARRSSSREVRVAVHCLDGTLAEFAVDRKASGRDIWDKFTQAYDLDEQDFFGLRLRHNVATSSSTTHGSGNNADGASYAIQEQNAHAWLTTDESALSQLGEPRVEADQPTWVLDFRLKFYIDGAITSGWSLRANNLLFLQLREDLALSRLVAPPEMSAKLAGLAAHVLCGPWDADQHASRNYLVAAGLCTNARGDDAALICEQHRQSRLMHPLEAQAAFIQLAQQLELYGVDLYFCKNEAAQVLQIGVAPQGVNIYRRRQLVRHYPWKYIKKLHFNKKKFIMSVKGETGNASTAVLLTLQTKTMCMTLFKSAKQHHTFFRRKAAEPSTPTKGAAALAKTAEPASTMYQAIRNSERRKQNKRSAAEKAAAASSPRNRRADEPEPSIERYSDHQTVVVKSDDSGFGLTLRGALYPHEPTGVYIATADTTDDVHDDVPRAGDLVLEMNGRSMERSSVKRAEEILKTTGKMVVLELAREPKALVLSPSTPPQTAPANKARPSRLSEASVILTNTISNLASPDLAPVSWVSGVVETVDEQKCTEVLEEIVFPIAPGECLGLSITGGADDNVHPGDDGIYIKAVIPGGAAERNGRLKEGDRLREINNVQLDHVIHDDAVAAIRQALLLRHIAIVVSRVVPVASVTREQQFNGRHGVVRRMVSQMGLEPRWQPGLLAQTDVLAVELGAEDEPLGMELVGTTEDHLRTGAAPPGVYISAVFAGTAAAMDGRIRRGMQLVDVNGWNVEQATVDEVWSLVAASANHRYTFLLRRNPAGFQEFALQSLQLYYLPLLPPSEPPGMPIERRMVVLRRAALSESWGLRIAGQSRTDIKHTKVHGIFVREVLPGAIAAQDGRLRPGDQILELNGMCFFGVPHEVAADAMRHSGLVAKLLVAYNPKGLDYLLEETKCQDLALAESLADNELKALTIDITGNQPGVFGFDLDGPLTTDDERVGVFVTGMSDQKLSDAGLGIGDQLVEINGEVVLRATCGQVLELLEEAQKRPIALVTASNPAMFEKYKSRGAEHIVQITRGAQGYGIAICGASGEDVEDSVQPRGVFISYITKHSPAARDGRLHVGDQILSINGTDLRSATIPQAMAVLDASPLDAIFIVTHNEAGFSPFRKKAREMQASIKRTEERRRRKSRHQLQKAGMVKHVTLTRPDNDGPFGFAICGPLDQNDECSGIFIASLSPQSPAEKSGLVHVGDQLLRVNQHDVRLATVSDTTHLLQSTGASVSLALAANPEGFAQYSQEVAAAVPRRKIVLCCQHGESDLGITLFGGSRDRDGSLALYIGVLHAGSPADHHSGLVVGDRVVNINGEPVDNMSLEQAQVLLDECGEQQSQLVLEVVDDAAGFRPFAEEARRRRSSFHGPPMPPTGVRLVELPSLHEAGPDLGFVLTGCSANEPGPQPSGVFVASVVRGSVAEQLGLQVGDQLMEASGAEPDAWVSMRSSTYQAANAHIAAMRTLGSCSLVVAENLDGYVFFSEQTCGTKRRVTLQRDSLDHPLGFDVVGPPRLTAGPQHQGVFVVQVDPLSRAKERGIAVGDQVLDVNGTSLLRLPHDKARRVVLQACGEITLLLRSNMAGYRRAAHVVAYLDSRSQRGSVSENEDSRAGSQRRRSSAVGAAGKQQSPLAPRANAGGVGGGSKDTSASTDADGSKRSRARLRSSRRKNRQAQLVTYPPVPFTVRALYSFQGDAAAGQLSFNIYEVLVVTDVTEDADWWTAKALSDPGKTGLIPSRRQRERTYKASDEWRQLCALHEAERERKPDMQDATGPAAAAPPQVPAYQVVEQRVPMKSTPRRPMAIVGPESVRISQAVQRLIHNVAFVHAIPHTSRPRRDGEIDGMDYNFVTRAEMEQALSNREFIEAGHYNGNLYGTSLQSVKVLAEAGKVVVLDTQLKAVKRLQQYGDIYPIVILLRPQSADDLFTSLQQAAAFSGGAMEPVKFEDAAMLLEATLSTEMLYRSVFTHVVHTGPDMTATIKEVARLVHQAYNAPFWVDVFRDLPLSAAPKARSAMHVGGTTAPLNSGASSALAVVTAASNASAAAGAAATALTIPHSLAPVTVVVRRNATGSFGFSVVGGVEDDRLPAIVLRQGMEPNIVRGPGLHKGDEIISVNGISVAGEEHERVVQMIKAAGDQVTLGIVPRKSRHSYHQRQDEEEVVSEADRILQEQIKSTLYAMTVPVTSRPINPGEVNGHEYDFVTAKEFEAMIQEGVFVEWGKHKGHYYGTRRVQPDQLEPSRRLGRTSTFKTAMKNKERKGTRVNTVILARLDNGTFGLEYSGGAELDQLPCVTICSNVIQLSSSYGAMQQGDCILAINGDNVAGCSTARVQQLLDDAGETVELLLLCRETRLSNKLHTLKDYLAPSVADDEVLRAIKADVQQGLQQSGSASANSIQQEHCRPGQAAAQQVHQHQLLQPSALQHQHRILPVTSRPPRHNERDGAEYNFVSRETFEQMVQANIFLEWGERDGHYYGTRKHGVAVAGDLLRCTSLTKRNSEQDLARARVVNVTRGSHNGFGFNIIDVDLPAGHAIFVSQVDPNGSAGGDEGLHEGMQILAINGQDVSRATRGQATEALRCTGDYMSLLVRSNLQAYAAFRKKLLQETRQQAATIEEQLKAVGGTNVRVVELARDAQGLGMCVEKNDRLGVVMVTQVVPGGAAGRSSQIFAGDAIVSVDGHAVQNWSQAETLSALKSRSRLTLVLAQIDAGQAPRRADRRDIVLQRGESGLGFTVASDEFGFNPRVGSVVSGGVAARSGQVGQGDRIVAINGMDVQQKHHNDVVLMLLSSTPTVRLTLEGYAHPLPPTAAASQLHPEKQQQDLRPPPPPPPAESLLHTHRQTVMGAASVTAASPAPANDPSTDRRSVVLERATDGTGFGMKVSSLADNGCGACITTILPGGAADRSGVVRKNDVIISVDGINVLEMPHDEVISLLVSRNTVTLLLSADLSLLGLELVPDRRRVELERGSAGLGIRVVTDEEAGLVRIADVVEGGAAAATGLIFVGDVIEAVDGVSMIGVAHEEAVAALSAGQFLLLDLVADDAPLPEEDAANDGTAADAVMADAAAHDRGGQGTTPLPLEDLQDLRVVALKARQEGEFGLHLAAVAVAGGSVIVGYEPGSAAATVASAQQPNSNYLACGDVVVELDGENVLELPLAALTDRLAARRRVMLALSADPALLVATGLMRVARFQRDPQRGLGLRICTDEDAGLVRVSYLTPGGAADRTGALAVGDILQRVNGAIVRGWTHEQVVALLSAAKDVELCVTPCLAELPVVATGPETADNAASAATALASSPVTTATTVTMTDPLLRMAQAQVGNGRPQLPNMPGTEVRATRQVRLERGRFGYGLTITTDPAVAGLVVANVARGSVAAKACVQAGDVIVALDGQNMAYHSHEQAVGLFQNRKAVVLTLVSGHVVVQDDEGQTLNPASIRMVTLRRNHIGFGLHLAEDKSHSAVRVSELVPGSAAELCGIFGLGDVLVSINGVNVQGLGKEKIVNMLQAVEEADIVVDKSAKEFELNPEAIAESTFELRRIHEGQSLGFSFETFDNSPGVFVKMVKDGGLAAASGCLFEGDRIVEVNGVPLMNAHHHEVMQVLANKACTTFRIRVMRVNNRAEVDVR